MHPTPQRRPAAHAFLADDQKIELTTALVLQQQSQVVSTLPPCEQYFQPEPGLLIKRC